jgi:hypothetical protein
MDNIADTDIVFDKDGISNYYYDYNEFVQKNFLNNEVKEHELMEIIENVKNSGAGNDYDRIIRISGSL